MCNINAIEQSKDKHKRMNGYSKNDTINLSVDFEEVIG